MSQADGWQSRKIRDLFASSIPGDWGSESSPEDGVPVLRSTNFRNDGSINFTDLVFRKIDASRLEKRRVKKGTILIEKSGGSPTQPAGRVVYCDRNFDGTASNFIEVIKVKDEFASRYVAFLLYRLYQMGLVLKYQQQTTGIINFKLGEYAEEIISLPITKPEQTKIAEVLSIVDRAIEQTEALIAKQQLIKTGLMQDLLARGIDEHGNIRSEATHAFKDSPLGRIPVEWEAIPLARLASLQRGYDIVESEFIAGNFPVISSSGIIGYHNKATATGPNVLVGRKGSIGNVHFVETDCWAHDTSLFVTNFFGNCEKYVSYLFSYMDLGKYGTKSGSPSLNRNDIHPLPIGRPSPAEQRAIVERLSNHDEFIGKVIIQRSKLVRIKSGLMHDLLTGERRVTALLAQTAAQ